MIEKEDLNASREPGSLEAFVLIREVSLGSDALSAGLFRCPVQDCHSFGLLSFDLPLFLSVYF